MTEFTNMNNIAMSMAVWLAEDNYDHNGDPKHISVTSLMKSTKQVILAGRVPKADGIQDISSMVASKLGTAVHDSIENTWNNPESVEASLAALNIPSGVRKMVVVNPEPGTDLTGKLPVYLEQRVTRQVGDWKVSGKYDFVGNGRIEDFKSTSTWTYITGNNEEKYKRQMSLYRWLNPGIITKDEGAIQFIFTDWSALKAKMEAAKGYPVTRILEHKIGLHSIAESEAYVQRKIAALDLYMDAPESDMPECGDEELWRTEPKYKYFTDPAKAKEKGARSTKNFDTALEANKHLAAKGKGVVVTVPGEVKGCRYCSAAPVCKQKDTYIANGTLKL